MTTSEDFDAAVERYHQAAGEFVKGNNETYKALFSQGEDVTVANPFFPATRGWKNVEDRMDRAAARWSEGEVIGFVLRGEAPDDLPRPGHRWALRPFEWPVDGPADLRVAGA
jgi:hypothetical protein